MTSFLVRGSSSIPIDLIKAGRQFVSMSRRPTPMRIERTCPQCSILLVDWR